MDHQPMAESTLTQPAPVSNWTPLLVIQLTLAVLCVAGFFSLAFMLFFVEVPKENQPTVFTMIGTFGATGFVSILGFFYGQAQSESVRRGQVTIPAPLTVTKEEA